MDLPSTSVRAATKRVLAGGLLLFSLFSLGSYWASVVSSRSLAALLSDPIGSPFSLAITGMLLGVAIASLGVATGTFDQHRDGYLRATRLCGAVGLVGVAGIVVFAVASGL
ncbi:hypothetical protein SAMN04487950_1473 [Halogranum rubrum]|uniref:Uncharacterized protein n=1 Tax=Halogranum rubrum TaxID=553466 RepID=A0A1I4D147_9EURY|nr:hypothetical protein [Halogranum rubrum]SFK85821.1 hypothetical protein SAMN04487950_1473 [Halogranum rubrum]